MGPHLENIQKEAAFYIGCLYYVKISDHEYKSIQKLTIFLIL